MQVDLSICCDNCREKTHLGSEEKFVKLALSSMYMRGFSEGEAMNLITRRREACIDEQALIEAHARGWRFYSSAGVLSSPSTLHHCPSCVEKKSPFGPRANEVQP